MKKVKVIFLAIILMLTIFVVWSQILTKADASSISQVVQPINKDSFFSISFWQRVAATLLLVLLSFVSGYFLTKIDKDRSTKRLSYATVVEKELVTIAKDVKEKVEVLYEGEKIEDLQVIQCHIKNTGKTVIKSQEIRFEFPSETRILDSSLEPAPQPEMKVEMLLDPTLKPSEKKYRIGHIERNQRVWFRFTVTSKEDAQPELHPFNESGDVDFSPTSLNKADDEKEKVTKFIFLFIMYQLIPDLINNVYPPPLSEPITASAKLIILVFLFPLIVPFSKSVSNIILALSDDGENNDKSKYQLSIKNLKTGGNLSLNIIDKD